MKPLNPRQERFCHFFVHYNNATVAAVEAGYERPSARKQRWRRLVRGNSLPMQENIA